MMHPSNWVAIIKTDQKIEVELCCRKLTSYSCFKTRSRASFLSIFFL